METSNLKNMLVLKNFPSNIVEEAIIRLKKGSKIKNIQKIQKIEGAKNDKSKKKVKEKDYIVKEAEMLVNQYISKMEKQQKETQENQKFQKR